MSCICSGYWGLSCEFLIVGVAPFLHAPKASLRQAVNGTTPTKEISTVKSSNVTLPQKHDLHFWYEIYFERQVKFLEAGIYN